MRRPCFAAAVAGVVLLSMAGGVRAQGWGGQPGAGYGAPGQGFPPPGGQVFGQGQEGGAPFPGGEQGGNPILGAWSSQSPAPGGGMMFGTIVYGPDGSFSLTSRAPTGTLTRIWGRYQVQPSGPNQWRLDVQPQGVLPQVQCAQVGGSAPVCNPTRVQLRPFTNTLAFNGPNMMQDGSAMWQRDPQPFLAQAQVPAQSMVAVPGAPGGGGGGGGGSRLSRDPYFNGQDDDLQQRRICSINGGSLAVVRGKLQCIN